MDKVRLDFYRELDGDVVVDDKVTYKTRVGTFSDDVISANEFDLGFLNGSGDSVIDYLIESFIDRENKGVQPVPDGFPVVVVHKNGMETKKPARLYHWGVYGGNGEIKSWKPDYDKLLEMQKEHDAKQEKPIEELMINAKESKMSKNNKHPHHDLIVEWAKDTSKFVQVKNSISDGFSLSKIQYVVMDEDGDYEFRFKPREFQKGHWYPCVDNDGDFSVKCFNGEVFSHFVGFDCGTECDDMDWIGESLGEIKFGGEE